MNDKCQVSVHSADHVTTIHFANGPNNHVDAHLLRVLVAALREADADTACRAVVLSSEGKNFCAGANFWASDDPLAQIDPAEIYAEGMKIFELRKPIVAAVQGAAMGAGAGLALTADFRIATPETRFGFNFTRAGFHPGFGLTCTLPRVVGIQKASLLFYTGQRIPGEEALAMNLADQLVDLSKLHEAARALAREIATSAPRAVQSARSTLRQGLLTEVRRANRRELEIQLPQLNSDDFREGVRAIAERRPPAFRDA
jgi:enoyl-CoA hydratase/carnithine racemase